MIDPNEVYRFHASQVAVRSAECVEAFKIFLQLFSAIVGGAIWLSLQSYLTVDGKRTFSLLSDVTVSLVALVTAVMVIDNIRSWYSYRVAISKMGEGVGFTKPNLRISTISEATMLVGIVGATTLFVAFNPFLIVAKQLTVPGAHP